MAEIRSATRADIAALLPLIQGYYADSPVPHNVDEVALSAHLERLVQPDNPLGGLLVVVADDETLVGFAFLYYGFDKRTLKRTVTLNDLYVAPAARRRGWARQLLTATFEWAAARHALQVQWQTRTSNHKAQGLYDTMGEKEQGWVHYFHPLS
ncbi:MAG: GNAT family N-acetyltransferase [Lactobacillus sp.]|nr:GNAT family N-acetyltransferase [Lactobacillus sp.]MCI2032280.1 GNAT family N-acetyltransferase [Lactobacillus sp.]